MKTVAVLCVDRNSVYKTMTDVITYDIDNDARSFTGGMPVVAHPPCRAWSAYCRHQAKPLPGEKDLAPWCVEQIRQCGGVLEHPAHSRLWHDCDLPLPGRHESNGLRTIWVQQSWFGDLRSKQTWLLLSGIDLSLVDIPFSLRSGGSDRRIWNAMSRGTRARTSVAMAEWLVGLARISSNARDVRGIQL